jgi:predicted transcriptional regulator of viral defense system
VDDLLEQVRLTNGLLRLAFGQAIEDRLASIGTNASAKKVLEALKDQEALSMDHLQQASGVPRSSLYALVSALERQGVLERPRRGYVAISTAAGPYIPS